MVQGFAEPGPVGFVYLAQAQRARPKQQINNPYVHPHDMRPDVGAKHRLRPVVITDTLINISIDKP